MYGINYTVCRAKHDPDILVFALFDAENNDYVKAIDTYGYTGRQLYDHIEEYLGKTFAKEAEAAGFCHK